MESLKKISKTQWVIFAVASLLFLAFFIFNPMENTTETKQAEPEPTGNPIVVINTSMGDIELELYPDSAPKTVENFISYVKDGSYDGTVFHRVIDGFMVQGGGFTPDGVQKPTREPIVLESDNGLKNARGTVAMARTNDPNSATSQFFINVADNDFLNYSPQNPGYAVFGKVINGMDVVDKIKTVKTGVKNGMPDWPVDDVVIEKAVIK
jgi:cyclophilin family peptidyl-prolyl cis-trans isomerase